MKQNRAVSKYSLDQTKFLSRVEVDHLEALLKRTLATEQERDALALILALRTGARAKELLNLRRDDYSRQDATIFVRGLKGSNNRAIPLPPWVCKALESYLRRLDGDVLFDIGYQRLRQLWLYYRPVKKKFHSLRHTFAILVYIQTRDVRLLQVALGHRSISNTLIYVDYIYSVNELKKIIF